MDHNFQVNQLTTNRDNFQATLDGKDQYTSQ